MWFVWCTFSEEQQSCMGKKMWSVQISLGWEIPVEETFSFKEEKEYW